MSGPADLSYVCLAESLPAEPPSEFRIFKAGENPTSKGTALFDAKAASDVMAEYARRGTLKMIDRNHDSLNADARLMRADTLDAQGYFRLELRNGELWAVDVKWTPEGADRVRTRKQIYMSPAFKEDPKTHRVMYLANVALTPMPATFDATPLVAASDTYAGLTQDDARKIGRALKRRRR